jgi:hypothetical protein
MVLLSLVALAACDSSTSPTPAEIVGSAATPTPAASGASSGPSPDAQDGATPIFEASPAARALRERAEAFAVARTEARFDDAWAFTSPAFQASCDTEQWFVGLIGHITIARAFSGLDDDAPVKWTVRLVEVDGDSGSVLLSISILRGTGWLWSPARGRSSTASGGSTTRQRRSAADQRRVVRCERRINDHGDR